MSVIRCIYIAALSVFASSLVFAETTTLAYDSSPLTPGSRIVAGDLSKNEFFILGKDDKAPVTVAENKEQNPSIKVATNNPKQFIPQVKEALHKTLKTVRAENFSKVAEKHTQTKIKFANRIPQHALHQSTHFYSFKQPAHAHKVNKLAEKHVHKFTPVTHQFVYVNHHNKHAVKKMAMGKV